MNPRDITQWVAERSRARRRGSEFEDWISTARQLHPVREPAVVTVAEWDQSIRMWEREESR